MHHVQGTGWRHLADWVFYPARVLSALPNNAPHIAPRYLLTEACQHNLDSASLSILSSLALGLISLLQVHDGNR